MSEQPVKCTVTKTCGKTYFREGAYANHIMNVHNYGERGATNRAAKDFHRLEKPPTEAAIKKQRRELKDATFVPRGGAPDWEEVTSKDVDAAVEQVMNISNVVLWEQGNIAERMWEPQIERRTVDSYVWHLSETDVLFIEEVLARKCEELRDDLNKVNFRTESPKKVVVDNHERTAEWIDEDGMFLGDSLHRLSSILFQSRFLRNNPDERKAL